MLTAVLTYWQGTSYGLLISVMIPKMELAMALVPVFVIPLMVNTLRSVQCLQCALQSSPE